MRTLMLLKGPFPPDIRVENEAASLLSAGHEVHLLCTVDRRGEVELPATLEKLVIHTMPRAWDDLPSWKRRLSNLPMLWFLNLYWMRQITALAREHGGFDVIHVHDLPLVRTGLWAGRRTGASVVADLHENYPMALRFYTAGTPLSARKRFRTSPRRWERYERQSVPHCPAVIAVVEEMKSRLVSVGVPSKKIAIVENFVDIDRFLSYKIDPSIADRFAGRFVISYVGGFGTHRGLDIAIGAMRKVAEEVPEALLVLVGDSRIRADLEQLTEDLGVSDLVRFEGKVDFDLVPSYIAASDVCIVPHIRSAQTEAALPHKLFQYMLLKKPVVASSCAGVARIVTDANSGLLFPPGDSDSLAQALIRLTDAELRERLGQNGELAVRDRYNWSVSERKLLDVYEALPATTAVPDLPREGSKL